MQQAVSCHSAAQTPACLLFSKDASRPSHQLQTIKAVIRLLSSPTPRPLRPYSIAFTRHVINNYRLSLFRPFGPFGPFPLPLLAVRNRNKKKCDVELRYSGVNWRSAGALETEINLNYL
jgi:hypothetical protein